MESEESFETVPNHGFPEGGTIPDRTVSQNVEQNARWARRVGELATHIHQHPIVATIEADDTLDGDLRRVRRSVAPRGMPPPRKNGESQPSTGFSASRRR